MAIGHTEVMDTSQEWYWDLISAKAVRADERGPGDRVLGPYPTREAAEHWREQVERRNDAWDEDEKWADDSWDDDTGTDRAG